MKVILMILLAASVFIFGGLSGMAAKDNNESDSRAWGIGGIVLAIALIIVGVMM